METHASVEKAHAYLEAQMSRSDSSRRVAMGPFVTISRESGSGGSALAEELSRRLDRLLTVEQPHWTVFDRNLVEKMLEHYRLSASLARFLPEDKVSEIDSSVGEILGLHPSIWTLVHQTNSTMRRLAGMGNVILVGRGANFATAGLAHGLHLRLVGSPELRCHRIASLRGLSSEQATTHNRKTDAARRDYVRKFFDADIDDPSSYDLILNMDRFAIERAADLVMTILQSRGEVVWPHSPAHTAPEPG
jgi:cytidylate kinase